MVKKIINRFVVAMIFMVAVSGAVAEPNLYERVEMQGYDDNNYYALVYAQNRSDTYFAYVFLRDPSYNLIAYCYGSPSSNPVSTTGSGKDGEAIFNTSELTCRDGGGVKYISMTCSFDGVDYRHIVGNESTIYMGQNDNYHSNYQYATADCSVKVDSYKVNLKGSITRDQQVE